MDTLQRQIRRARRRLAFQRFLDRLGWCWFAALAAAVVLIAVDKFRPLGVEAWAWAAGALAVGLIAAAVWTLLVRGNSLEAAMEIDHRFGLKERVSSALALSPADRETRGRRGAGGRRRAPHRADRRGRAVRREAAAAAAVAASAGRAGRDGGAAGQSRRRREVAPPTPTTRPPSSRSGNRRRWSAVSLPSAERRPRRRACRTPSSCSRSWRRGRRN